MNPCKECPFRKLSAPGYIGGHDDVGEITGLVMADRRFPCHMDVNAKLESGLDFGDAADEARHCRGALILLNNTCKLSRNPAIAAEQKTAGRSDEVFASRVEMEAHHRQGREG